MKIKKVHVFHKEELELPAPSQFRKMKEMAYVMLLFVRLIQNY